MAVDAFFLHRLMDEFLSLECLGLVGVTLEAHIISGSTEKLGKVRLVRVMTHGAASYGNRTVYVFAGQDFFVVAEKTEVSPFGTELVFIGGLVRIVAFRAFAVFHRFVDSISCIYFVVTLVTEFPGALDG